MRFRVARVKSICIRSCWRRKAPTSPFRPVPASGSPRHQGGGRAAGSPFRLGPSAVPAGRRPVSAHTAAQPTARIPEELAARVPGKASAENFPVAPRFLPAVVRRDLMAIYGFARLVDDLGDEAAGGPAERERLLDAVEGELDRIDAGAEPHHPLLRALVP